MSISSPPSSISTTLEDATSFALHTDELILAIFNALIERHPQETKTSWSSLLQCMLVNKQWCRQAQSILWRRLGTPKIALDAVIHQFEISKDGQPGMSLEDLYFRQPHSAFVRYRHYTAQVESLDFWISDSASDQAFCTVLQMTGLRGRVYPRLRTVNLLVDPQNVWFPLCFRTRDVTDVTLQRLPVEPPRPLDQNQPPREIVPLVQALHDVAEYCPSLKRLNLPQILLPIEMEHLQTIPFASLRKLALNITTVQTNDFIQILLSLAGTIQEVELEVCTESPHPLNPPFANCSMHTLPRLQTLYLRIPAAADYSGRLFRKFPRAPALRKLDISDVTVYGRARADGLNSIFRPMETFLNHTTLSSLALKFSRAIAPVPNSSWRKLTFDDFYLPPSIIQPSLERLKIFIFHYEQPTFEDLAAKLNGLSRLRELRLEFQVGKLYLRNEYLPMQILIRLLPLLPRLEMLEVHTDGRKESNPLIWTKVEDFEESMEEKESLEGEEKERNEWMLNEEIERYASESLRYWWFLGFDRDSPWHTDQMSEYKEVLKRVAPNLNVDCGEQFERDLYGPEKWFNS